ncbi:MAG: exodeoxyribonuclease small subunit [Bacteroidota bacterium]|jgi:exodeoxyribonuclease VII small subunit
MSYTKAYTELQKIVAQLESGNISIDQLASKVAKAKELLAICESQLRSVENTINEITENE